MKTPNLWTIKSKCLFLSVVLFCTSLVANTQIVFTAGSVGCNTSGICIGSGCVNAANVSDGDPGSFGTMNTTIGVGCTVTLAANFASIQPATNWTGFEVRAVGLATVLSNITLRIFNTGTSQSQQAGGSAIIQLLATDRGFIQIQSTIPFDQVQIDLASVVGVAQSLDVFFGYSNVAKLLFALPVTLVQFDVAPQDKDAILSWRTSSEQNSNRFEIEQSLNGVAFSKIAEVAAAGNSTGEINYSYTDHNIGHYGTTLLYYRLRQVDNDDRASYSPIRSLGVPRSGQIHTYPIPFRDVIAVDLPAGMNGVAEINLTDMAGRLVFHRTDNISDTQTGLVLTNLNGLPGGTYILTIRTAKDVKNIKLIKQ
ncbi:MAG: T9SS type A sorting domain-containing protein [Bacteroidetes bacterium]|nr:MAG: T9SS type A sorting domain-containing protein [Bacteroidota bacterium]